MVVMEEEVMVVMVLMEEEVMVVMEVIGIMEVRWKRR